MLFAGGKGHPYGEDQQQNDEDPPRGMQSGHFCFTALKSIAKTPASPI
jgi:hypothetical protein